MPLKIIDVTLPELPFTSPLLGGVQSGDKLTLQVEMEPKSSLLIAMKSSDPNIYSKNPFGLSLTLDGDELGCKWGENNKWREDLMAVVRNTKKKVNGIINMSLVVEQNKYCVRFDNDLNSTFHRRYSQFQADTLEIGIPTGKAVIKRISLTREIRWLGASIASSELALKCGKDEFYNDIFLGRWLRSSTMMVVKFIPASEMVTTAFDGREWPLNCYDLLVDSGRYGWTSIGEDMMIPTNAIQLGYFEDGKTYIGRVAYEGAVIPGTIYKESGILSIPFGGKEVKISSGYEVLVALPPLFPLVQNQLLKSVVRVPTNRCVLCYTNHITTAFVPCMHLGFCETCAKKLLERSNKCPICHKDVTSQFRIHKV